MSIERRLLLLAACIVVAFVVMELVDDWNFQRHRPGCDSFRWQEEAQIALSEGNRRLDGDKDGTACEGLPPRPIDTPL